jgi:hypothetical protein
MWPIFCRNPLTADSPVTRAPFTLQNKALNKANIPPRLEPDSSPWSQLSSSPNALNCPLKLFSYGNSLQKNWEVLKKTRMSSHHTNNCKDKMFSGWIIQGKILVLTDHHGYPAWLLRVLRQNEGKVQTGRLLRVERSWNSYWIMSLVFAQDWHAK